MINKCIKTAMVTSLLSTQYPFALASQIEEPQLNLQKKPYEIIITPTMRKSDIRQLIVDIEDDFFDKFNEINQNDNFDIHCYLYTPTMSHIQKRVCEPVFALKARGLHVSWVQQMLSNKYDKGSAVLNSPNDLRWEVKEEYERLEQMLEEQAQKNAEFRDIADALQKAKISLSSFDNEG